MDTLLTLAFDNLSSRQASKQRKGLRQIEGLLAQICLSSPTTSTSRTSSPSKSTTPFSPYQTSQKNPSATSSSSSNPNQTLASLALDPAFQEFSRLQSTFDHNICTHLLELLNSLLSTRASLRAAPLATLVPAALSILLGLLLMHAPSRSLFARKAHMTLLLDLLDPVESPSEVLLPGIDVLVAALLGNPRGMRRFEKEGGLETVVAVFKAGGNGSDGEMGKGTVTREVRCRALEFLYFYLLPETGPDATDAAAMMSGARVHSRRGTGDRSTSTTIRSNHSGGSDGSGSSSLSASASEPIRSLAEKQALLGRHLANVDDLVNDLRMSAPFGMAIS